MTGRKTSVVDKRSAAIDCPSLVVHIFTEESDNLSILIQGAH